MRVIGASLKRGRSILSLHLSGNPGINNALKEYLSNRIRCAPQRKMVLEGAKETFDKAVRCSLEGYEPLNNFIKDGVELSHIFKLKKSIH
jgi:hypothetical protein